VAQFMHLLCGEVAGAEAATLSAHAPVPSAAEDSSDADWRAKMEAEITLLKAQVSRLQTLIGAVK
jgi:uncharacterized protein YceH (UPF0502 family)